MPKTTRAPKATGQHIASTTPRPVATDLPPENFSQIERLWPTNAASPAKPAAQGLQGLLIKRRRWRDERMGEQPRTEPANNNDRSHTFKDIDQQHDQRRLLAENTQRVRGPNGSRAVLSDIEAVKQPPHQICSGDGSQDISRRQSTQVCDPEGHQCHPRRALKLPSRTPLTSTLCAEALVLAWRQPLGPRSLGVALGLPGRIPNLPIDSSFAPNWPERECARCKWEETADGSPFRWACVVVTN